MTTSESGWMEVICGPMFSGKSEELIRRLRRAQVAGLRVQVFKPALDNRYSETEIVSHGDVKMACQSVACAYEILNNLHPATEMIGIDEANFFGDSLVGVADQLASSGVGVIIAGLDTDFLGRPFLPMPALLSTAEFITKMLAVCTQCGAPAKHSQRMLSSQELILVGAAGAYEARCRRCFQPDTSHSEELEFVPAQKAPIFRCDET